MKRNPYLTAAMYRMLKAMRDGEDHYAISERREAWVDSERFSSRTVDLLLQLCLIRLESTSTFRGDGAQIWYLNSEGKKIIDDPNYVPLICKELDRTNDTGRAA